MRKNDYLNALEVLDVSVPMKSVDFAEEFYFVANLIKYAFGVVLEEVDEAQSIPLNNHYTLSEEYKRVKNSMDSLCSTLIDLQGALLHGIDLSNLIYKNVRVDIKPLLILLPHDECIEVIDMCLKYVNDSIELFTKCNQNIGRMEELKAILIAIREEELSKRKSEDREELPF